MNRLPHKLAALALLVLLPLFLRAWPIDHGGAKNYVPDTHIVRAALGMAKDKDLVPPVGKYSHYPNLLPYMLLPAYAAQYALGPWQDAREFGNHLLDHPEDARIVARWLIALFGALTPLVAFRAARAMGLERGAWIAAWLVATGLLHVHFSVQERPWVPMTFFLVLAAWPAALYTRDPRARWLVLSGVAAGLSFACHQSGLPAIAIPAIAWLASTLRWSGRSLATRLGHGFACVAACVVAGVLLGHPYFLRYGIPTRDQVIMGDAVDEEGGLSLGGVSVIFDVRLESLARLSRAFVGYDLAVVVLGVCGLWFALRRASTRPVALFALGWSAFFLTNRSDHVRYLLPVAALLVFPAGLVGERLLRSRVGTIALVLLLAFPLVQAVRFDHVLARTDTRALMAQALRALPDGAVVALDRYGPDVELDRASLHRLDRLRTSLGQPLYAREDRRRLALDRGEIPAVDAGINAVRVEEVLAFDERARTMAVRAELRSLGADPKSALQALGVTHFLLVDRRPGDERGPLTASIVAGASRELVVDPSSGARTTAEAFLPTEMDFPLTGLWSVQGPGPWMALYRLR